MKPLARPAVTNVVNLRPKTTIFGEKAVGLTTFVTTRKRSARNHSAQGPTGVEAAGGSGARGLRCPWAVAGPGRASRRRTEPDNSDPAPLVRRAPEGPEGTGGLRGAAPNAVRPPSLAGGRALRRPEHPWRHKQPGPRMRKPRPADAGRGLPTQSGGEV